MSDGTKTRIKKSGKATLPLMQPTVAGIDIGSTQHWVAAPSTDGDPNVRVFGTTTPDLVELVQWLQAQGVTSAAMESTSVYWIPLYELLESRGITPVLVDARHLRNVPGRKTDFLDCQWLQLLHSRGLLRGSFRPSESIARLRALHRQMANLVAERTRYVQWMQKALDQMNVQVHRAVTDMTGKTGMKIIRAIVAGERNPAKLALLRDGRCHKTLPQIARHLIGTWREEHLFNLAHALRLHDVVDETIASYQERLLRELETLQPPERQHQEVRHPNATKERSLKAQRTQELRTTLWRVSGVDLTRIDGIGADAAEVILTEVGTNVSAFPTEGHFVSWLRLSPRVAISGGKPVSKRRNGLGSNRVAGVLRMAAVSLHRSKTALGAAFRRIARKKGHGIAVFAIARQLAQLVYRAVRYGHEYVDAGERAYEKRFEQRRLNSLAEAARSLGFDLVKQNCEVAT